MPELPEVETLNHQLKQTILGAVIEEIVILDEKIVHPDGAIGQPVQSVTRLGKYLLICLGHRLTLHLHLRMSGRLLWRKHAEQLPVHSRFVLRFAHGDLVCVDPRRFATLVLNDPKSRAATFPDPLTALDARSLHRAAQGRRAVVKAFLLNQSIVSGIGNIYACEMLHEAGVAPQRSANSLSLQEWRRIARAGRSILRRATDCRGTSISDWRDLFGEKGEYQHQLRVYGREGLPCGRCKERITRTIVVGRGTWHCTACQV